ncbi:hypothetical protein NDA11_007202 [Ustilago hordei]|nr:hypothetical protein NDA15_003917 [Ustilago hordei]KAJ1591214.1 hypothetical protein NDA11_007202 [Ustilago hordei]KAJ1600812.1 hypothetical protein NDA14_003970 [Ustilago hordei]
MSLQFLSDKESLPSQSSTSPIVSVCWTAPSNSSQGLIFAGDLKGSIKVFDAGSGLAYRNLPTAHSNAVHCLSTDAKGTMVLSSAIDGSIALWDIKPFYQSPAPSAGEGENEGTVGNVDPPLLSLPVEDTESLIVSKLDSLKEKFKPSEAWKTVLAPYDYHFAATGAGARVSGHLIDHQTFGVGDDEGEMPSYLAELKDLFGLSLAFSGYGLIAVGTNTGHVLLYRSSANANILSLVTVIADHASPIRSLAFTDNLLLVGSDNRTITVHDIKPVVDDARYESTDSMSVSTVASLTAHKGWILGLEGVPGAQGVFASISADKSIKFWDLGSATKNTPVWNGSEVNQIRAFSFQPLPKMEDHEDPKKREKTTGSMTRFVTASEDGRLRWYRGAGLG